MSYQTKPKTFVVQSPDGSLRLVKAKNYAEVYRHLFGDWQVRTAKVEDLTAAMEAGVQVENTIN